MGLGLLTREISLLNFYTYGCGAKLFHVHAPSYQSGWMWFLQFCSVRLPFNSISDVLSDGCSIF